MDHRAITLHTIHGVVLDTMRPTRYGIIIGTIHVLPVQINPRIHIIPVIQHHQACTQWKAIAHGAVMRGIINLVHHVHRVQVCHMVTVVPIQKQ